VTLMGGDEKGCSARCIIPQRMTKHQGRIQKGRKPRSKNRNIGGLEVVETDSRWKRGRKVIEKAKNRWFQGKENVYMREPACVLKVDEEREKKEGSVIGTETLLQASHNVKRLPVRVGNVLSQGH